jgi:predicted metal-dependent HD superfamily phosphohydrolase
MLGHARVVCGIAVTISARHLKFGEAGAGAYNRRWPALVVERQGQARVPEMSLIDETLKADLLARYGEAGRHYHGLGHIEALLGLMRDHGRALSDPEVVEAAIWFHDAVYDTRAKDNEAQSAALAALLLKDRLAPARLAAVVAMIEATASHRVPAIGSEDAALFLDMDLSILGEAPAVFDAYEQGVRLEYRWVPDDRWRQGRAAVLAGFLDRPRIFHTDIFGDRYEAPARDNIRRSLARLGA